MTMPKIYLAGQITGLPSRGAPWRDVATEFLSPLEVINPLKLELDPEKPEELVAADIAAIATCQCILTRCDYPSWGTAMELWYAKGLGLPIVAWLGQNNGLSPSRLSPWLRYCISEKHFRLADATNSIRERYLAHIKES